MSEPEIKPCPFCGSEPELTIDVAPLNHDAYISAPDYYKVICTGCKACSGSVRKPPFCAFTAYTVEAFRTDPTLRKREDAEYNKYLDKLKVKTIKLWNQRNLPTEK